MEKYILVISLVGFFRAFYLTIGEPMREYDNSSIFSFYTENISRLIAFFHKVKLDKSQSYYYQINGIAEKYYRFLGFCFPCFSFLFGAIILLLKNGFSFDFILQYGVLLLLILIINKWT